MEKALILAIATTVLFCLLKFLEMKYIEKEIKSLKYYVRDVVMVFVSSFVGVFGLLYFDRPLNELLSVVTDNNRLIPEHTEIFTGAPGF